MKGISCSLLFLSVFLFSFVVLKAQTKEDLQHKKKILLEEIKYTNVLLEKTKKSQTSSMDELVKLNKKIEARSEVISTIKQEINLLDKKIEKNKLAIAALESNLTELKDEYAKMLYYTYKNKSSYNRLMFMFSSKDFNQAYKRLKYLQQYSSYRKRQAELIIKTKEAIDAKITKLEGIRTEKASLALFIGQRKAELQ